MDLVDTIPVRRVKVTFGSGYATHFQIRLSVDGENWQTVADVVDHGGQPFALTLEPTPARYVRVCGLKPDGPDQPGTQMSLAELEVYR